MKGLLELARRLRLVEMREDFDARTTLPSDVFVIPRGTVIEGQFRTNLPVLIEGQLTGGVHIEGDAVLTLSANGLLAGGAVSANRVQLHGPAHNMSIDADVLELSATGSIEGQSEVRYGTLAKHVDAPVNGLMTKRRSPRDSFTRLGRPVLRPSLSE